MSDWVKGDGARIKITFDQPIVGFPEPTITHDVAWSRDDFTKSSYTTARTNGYAFVANSDITVTKLSCYSDGVTTAKCHLWDFDTQQMLTSAEFSTSGNSWASGGLASPIALGVGKTYVITCNTPINGGYMYADLNPLPGDEAFSNHVSFSKGYRVAGQDTFPTIELTGDYIAAVGFEFSVIDKTSGKESAFTVSVPEYAYVPDGTIIDVAKSVKYAYLGDTDNELILEMEPLERFESAAGDIAVAYNGSGGIAGQGGAVQAFTRTFTPTDLVPKPDQNDAEHIEISNITATGTLTRIYYTDAQNGGEHIEITGITATGTLTHVDDI